MTVAARTGSLRDARLFASLAVLWGACVLLAVAWGAEPISWAQVFGDPTSIDRVIAVQVRLPRVLLASVVGGGLGMVGAAFQTLLRNPLAEPYLLGVSGGASLGATLAILFASGPLFQAFGVAFVPLAAFGGGLLAMVFVQGLARAGGGASPLYLLLAGVIVNSMASAGITFLRTLVSAQKGQELLFWLVGFLDVPSPLALAWVSFYVALGAGLLLWEAPRLNLFALGRDAVRHLGVEPEVTERRVVLGCSLAVGAIVSVTGLIGFVGLVVPNVVRRLWGPKARVQLAGSFLLGAVLLVVCDLVSRVLFRWTHSEPPVGAVTALVGGPVFLWLLPGGAKTPGATAEL